jgi:hypothetical protein
MTKRFFSLCIAVAAVAVVGCGSSSSSTPAGLCDKATSAAPGIAAKFTPCFGTTGGGVTVPSGTSCTTAIANCSDADRAVLNSLLDCLSGLPTCSTATQTDFLNKLSACGDPTSKGVSAACAAAF